MIEIPVTLDFETKPIEEHKPPPPPVGLAIRWQDGRMEYLAWGHRTGNNISFAGACDRLRDIINSGLPLLFQNGKFDLGVAFTHMLPKEMLGRIAWTRLHDTQFLLVLRDPYARSLHLKDAAHRYLNMPPTERDEIVEWLMANELPTIQAAAKRWEKPVKDAAKAFVWLAPTPMVAKYAIGDVDRTYKLYDHLYPQILAEDMGRAYDLERRVLGPLTAMELRGLHVDKERMIREMEELRKGQQEAALRIYDKLNEYVDIGSKSLARVLHRKKAVTGLSRTAPSKRFPDGQISTAKDSLENANFVDPELRELIMYHRSMSYIFSNSLDPWLETINPGNIILTSWNQTRGTNEDGDSTGARTLRLSCAWLLNIANERELRYGLLPGLPKVPSPRSYVIPHEGYTKIVSRDWKQQEYRIAAHFEDGPLMEAYKADPWMDKHDHSVWLLDQMGFSYKRKIVKVVNLALLYAMGVGKLAAKLKISIEAATALRNAVKRTIPGVVQLMKDVQNVERERGFIRTYMGAKLTREPPMRLEDGRVIDFGYKLLNHLIQRSAAEQMKEVVARWHEDGYAATWQWMLSVHDQNDIECTDDNWRRGATELDAVMRAGAFDVAMLSDLAVGTNWGALEDIKEERS